MPWWNRLTSGGCSMASIRFLYAARAARSPTTITTGGRTDRPAMSPTGCAMPAPMSAAASETGISSASVVRLTRATSSRPIALILLCRLDRPEEIAKPRGNAHADPDQREPGSGAEPAIQVIPADGRPGRRDDERDAYRGKHAERPPWRGLFRHRAHRQRGRGSIM